MARVHPKALAMKVIYTSTSHLQCKGLARTTFREAAARTTCAQELAKPSASQAACAAWLLQFEGARSQGRGIALRWRTTTWATLVEEIDVFDVRRGQVLGLLEGLPVLWRPLGPEYLVPTPGPRVVHQIVEPVRGKGNRSCFYPVL